MPGDLKHDPFHLARFVEAQAGVYERVVAELREGEKSSHWMWFIFPQIAGLGSSGMAQRYAINSIEEARAYLDHPVLGPRLLECARLVTEIHGKSVEEIFGYPDDMKFKSSMTLFAIAADEDTVFLMALALYFNGQVDRQTVAVLGTI